MVNIHPILAHFPFVILCLALGCEFAAMFGNRELGKSARMLVLLVAAVSPLTYLSGYIGLEFANHSFEVPKEAISQHQLLGKIFLISLVPTVLFYLLREEATGRLLPNLSRFFLLLSFTIAVAASYYGGELVFSYGAGVLLQR